jgi:hypothetical protein
MSLGLIAHYTIAAATTLSPAECDNTVLTVAAGSVISITWPTAAVWYAAQAEAEQNSTGAVLIEVTVGFSNVNVQLPLDGSVTWSDAVVGPKQIPSGHTARILTRYTGGGPANPTLQLVLDGTQVL